LATTIEIPDFDFSGFYYAQILDALVNYKRLNVPEHTDESPYDPYMQFLRMQALVGHLNNVLIDLVANESTLPTAKLVDTVRNMLRLIAYEMSPASPAQVDVVFELSKIFIAPSELIPDKAQTSTRRQGDVPIVYYEKTGVLDVARTDQLGKMIAFDAAPTPIYTDYTTKANSQTSPGDDWTPWATPVAGDMLYFGHPSVMWNKLGIWFATPATDITGVWEYYDGEWKKTTPTEVELYPGGKLLFNLNNYLGVINRAGSTIRVQYNETGAYEEHVSLWDGTKNYVVVNSYLGQTSPKYNTGGGSPTPDAQQHYAIGSVWEALASPTDGTQHLTQNGDLEYTLPQDLNKNWQPGIVDGSTQYWLRFRIIEVSTPTPPVVQYARIDQGKQYVCAQVTQGRTFEEAPLGSSDGTSNQEFETSQEHFISNSDVLTVEGEIWTRVDNFLASKATDKHYRVELEEDDRALFIFGDGVTGKVPPVGVGNVSATYRYGGDTDGNVGANTITSDKTGLTYINKLWNPRPAAGWDEAQGSTEESLERAKIAGPASLRIVTVALGPSDVEQLAIAFKDNSGAKPYSRAKAIEEGFGPKTIELVVVAKGGEQASATQLSELSEYFNGNPYAHPVIPKHIVSNQEATAINYTPKVIDITATVYGNVTQEAVENALQQIIQPEALKDDEVSYEWDFGGEVPTSRISHEIFNTNDGITRVDLIAPVANTPLLTRELPVLGTVTLTIVES
jgi:hypothetical protein